MKKMLVCAFFLLVLGQCVVTFAQYPSSSVLYGSRAMPLVDELGANRYGLTRAWFNRLRVAQSINEVEYVLLHQGTIFVVTSDARLHAVDAETGATLWVEVLDESHVICQTPSANSRMVGVIAGVKLIILDRTNGKRIFETDIHGFVGFGCVLSEKYVYVPQVTGRIMAWPLIPVVEERPFAGTEEDISTDAAPFGQTDSQSDPHDEALARIKMAVESAKAALLEKEQPEKKDALRLEPPIGIPVECQSFGHVLAPPEIATQNLLDEYVSWPTTRGDLYIGSIGESTREHFDLLYKARISPQAMLFQHGSGVEADWVVRRDIDFRPTYCPPIFLDENGFLDENPDNVIVPTSKTRKNRTDTTDVTDALGQASGETEENEQAVDDDRVVPNMVLVGNAAGYIVAVDDLSGSVLWNYALSSPISQRIIAIKNRVYACSLIGGMYALDAKTGREIWYSPGIDAFIAESANHIYVLNRRKEIAVLERESGKVLSTFCAIPFDFAIENFDSDRIFLMTKSGLVQCLHELTLETPLKHRPTSADLAAYNERLLATEAQSKADRPRPTPAVTAPEAEDGFDDDPWDTESNEGEGFDEGGFDEDAGFGEDDFGGDGFEDGDFDF